MTNFNVKEAGGNTVAFKSTTVADVETPHKNAQLMVSNAHVSNTNPVAVALCQANVVISNANPIPVSLNMANAIISNTNPVPVLCISDAYTSSNSFTPAAAAYLANDIMATSKVFVDVGPSAGKIRITGCELEVDHTAVISGETSYRLYMYNVTPPSAAADNDAFDLPAGDRASFLGYIDLGTPVDLGSTLYVQTLNINKEVKLTTANLHTYLVTNGPFTATAAARKVTLHTVRL